VHTVRRCVLLLVLMGAAGVVPAGAQDICPCSAPAPKWEVGTFVGVATNSPIGEDFGATPDRDHLFIGLLATKEVIGWRGFRLSFAPQLVPVAVVTNNPTYTIDSDGSVTGYPGAFVETGRGLVYGVGFVPLGLEAQLDFAPRWRVYGGGAVGGVWFTRDVPVAYSRAFNYTFEYGGGLQWEVRPGRWLRVGYKFHHLSNAGSAPLNPGVDANTIVAGMTLVVGK